MFPDAAELVLYALIPLAVGVGGYLAFRGSRKRSRPLSIINDNLEAAANEIESDLTQLQLEDSHDLLSQGWNRLINELADARHVLEGYQVRQQAQQTVDRYQFNWVTELLNRMPYGLVMVGEDLGITFVNATAERMLAQPRDELQGRKVTDVFDESLASLASPAGGTIERTLDLASPGISLQISAVKTDGDAQTALFLKDMTGQKEMERARDQFLYHVTHELRTPLTNIRAYAETLSEGVLQDRESLRECYNVIISETDRLSRLVEDILSVSQLEAGSATLKVDDVQTARLIRQVVEDMQAHADDKNVELILSMPSKVPVIRGDKGRLLVVLTNLVGNAIKYTPPGGQVEVSCVEDGARLQITVRDTGIGIASEDQAKVFDKFFRSSDERVAQLPGTGLGLAITRETVRAHGGTIELASEPGKGATFVVTLPIGRSSAIKAGEDD